MKCRIAFAALLLTTTSAIAADLAATPTEPTVPAYVPYSWTGFYVGVHAGVVGTNVKETSSVGQSFKFDDTAFIGGGHAGLNYEFPEGLVIGFEGDFDGTNLSKSKSLNGVDPGTDLSNTLFHKFKSDWQASIRTRVGYAFDRFLPYITGGVAFADEKFGITDVLMNGFTTAVSKSNIRTGSTIGGGVEYAVTDNVLIRGEVRYSDFGKSNYVLTDFVGRHFNGKVRFDEVAATIGLSYKFSSDLF